MCKDAQDGMCMRDNEGAGDGLTPRRLGMPGLLVEVLRVVFVEEVGWRLGLVRLRMLDGRLRRLSLVGRVPAQTCASHQM